MAEHIIIAPYLQEFFVDILKQKYVVHDLLGFDQPSDIPGIELDKVRAAVTRGEATFTGAFMDQLPNLGMIANFGVGYDGIDDAAAIERGIILTNTPDVLTAETANLALALTLAVTRKVVEGDSFIRQGRWANEEFGMASSIIGKTIGMVGLGRIGRAVAERFTVCGATVIYNDIQKVDGVDYPYYADLVDMAGQCDLLVNTCIGGDATNGLISKAVIDALKPTAFFVSSSRGSVVDEPALVQALVEGRIAGVGMDVFANEPNVPQELLSRTDNVVLLPHTGSRTADTWKAMADLCLANMDKYFAGEPVLTPVPGSLSLAGRK